MSDFMTHQLVQDRQRELMASVRDAAEARQARKARRAARRRARD
jgi:hypothetical protein